MRLPELPKPVQQEKLEIGEVIEKINVMIVGDFLIFRNGLRMLLETRENFKVINEAADLREAALVIGNRKPDVLLVDSSEVAGDGFADFLSSVCDGIPTLVLTNSPSPVLHQKYLLQGASGVVSRKQGGEVLFKAVERVNADDLWFRREVMKKTIEKLMKEKLEEPPKVYSKKYESLTEREQEVLKNVCKGMKNKEIAETLSITETTVRHHLTSIFEKLSVKSRLALAILAFNEGLVDVPPLNDNES